MKSFNKILLIFLSFFIIIYGIAYVMKDRANNNYSREICLEVWEGPQNIINLVSKKLVKKEIFQTSKSILKNRNPKELLKKQKSIEKKIEKEYLELEYTWKRPYIKVNPYGTTPLSVLIKFKTYEPEKVKIEIVDRNGTNLEFNFNEYVTEHEYDIFGLYIKGETEINIILESKKNEIKRKKLKIKSNFVENLNGDVVVLENNILETNLYMIRDGGVTIFDNYGNIRGIFLMRGDHINLELKNGNYLNGFEENNIIFEENKIGKILKVYNLGEYSYHHHALEMENGNFLLAVTKKGTTKLDQENNIVETVEDYIIEIDKETGKIIKEFDLGSILDVNRLYQGEGKGGDWLHVNSFIYSKEDNSLIISANHQGIIKIDYKTGKLKWIMAYHKDWRRAGRDGKGEKLDKYLLYATDEKGNRYSNDVQSGDMIIEEFRFPVGQHDLSFIEKNQILMFDNKRLTAPVYKNNQKDIFSRSVIYEIDEKNMNVKEIWSFGKEMKEKMYSPWVSSVEYFCNSILIGAGVIESSNEINGRILQINKKTKKIELDMIYISKSSHLPRTFYQVNKLGAKFLKN